MNNVSQLISDQVRKMFIIYHSLNIIEYMYYSRCMATLDPVIV